MPQVGMMSDKPTYEEVEIFLIMQVYQRVSGFVRFNPSGVVSDPMTLEHVLSVLKTTYGIDLVDSVVDPSRVELIRQLWRMCFIFSLRPLQFLFQLYFLHQIIVIKRYLEQILTLTIAFSVETWQQELEHDILPFFISTRNRMTNTVSPNHIQRREYFQPTAMAFAESGNPAALALTNEPRHPDHPNYQGDLFSKSFALNESIDKGCNCALFLTGIPPNAGYADVFSCIRCGAVAALHMNDPDLYHEHQAAKLVFKSREGSIAFFQQVKEGYIRVLGQQIQVRWNRNMVGQHRNMEESRVIRIREPPESIHPDVLHNYFRRKFSYRTQYIRYIGADAGGRVVMEWAFARIDTQAVFAKMVIDRELWSLFAAEFVKDPCDQRTLQ